MHEFSITQNLIDSLIEALSGYPTATRVEEVILSIGELSFAGEEQIRFCFSVLSEDDDRLRDCSLVCEKEKGEVVCKNCGYNGPLGTSEGGDIHRLFPVFACPECGKSVEITRGRTVTIKNARITVEGGEIE